MKRSLVVLGVVGVCALPASAKVTVVNSSPRTVLTAPATRGPAVEAASREREKWVGTRAIVRDAKTNKLRKPTESETRELVKTIKQLTTRASIRTESAAAQGGVIESGSMQVVVARATEEGTMETLCVGSFEEAAEFLGLKQQQSTGSNEQ
ncbi:MAG: post-PEP-CTERM-1 domain-containing protein [Thermoanaerobaculia bacterium]